MPLVNEHASNRPTHLSDDVFETVFTSRKSWKTNKESGELVWSPELEAALLEGLELYNPGDSREARVLGRFPKRNCFISKYIFQKTGKQRSPKQIGSRLQQLRDSCNEHKLHRLLTHGRVGAPKSSRQGFSRSPEPPVALLDFDQLSATDSTPSGSECESLNLLSSPQESLLQFPTRREVVIELLPTDYPWSVFATDEHAQSSALEPVCDDLFFPSHNSDSQVSKTSQPRHIRTIDPTIAFSARTPSSSSSHCAVFFDDALVHSEIVPLTLMESSPPELLLYRTTLAPSYWQTICESVDPTRYSIIQEIFPKEISDVVLDLEPTFSAIYRFRYPRESSMVFSTPNMVCFNERSSCSSSSDFQLDFDPDSAFFDFIDSSSFSTGLP